MNMIKKGRILLFIGTGLILLMTALAFLLDTGNIFCTVTIALVAVVAMISATVIMQKQIAYIDSIADFANALTDDNKLASPFEPISGDNILWPAIKNLSDAFLREAGMKKGIIEGLPTPFLLVDTKERTMFTNQACMDMVEISSTPQSQYGKTLSEIFYNDPTRKSAVGQSIQTGKIFKNLEVSITGHKGGVRHVLANVYPLYDINHKCIGGFCLYIDMTDLKEKEAQLSAHNDKVAKSAMHATEISDRLASATEELSAQVEQSSATSTAQQNSTREVSVAIEQMNETVIEVARGAGNAAELADSAKKKALEGEDAVVQSTHLITNVHKNALQLKDEMHVLSEQVDSIGNVINVINDIADQTNLLALNAAIEAARAGEAGRGFAVVADEVRKLAEKTMQATNEVTSAINNIQQSTQKSMTSSEKTALEINENKKLAEISEKLLEEIVKLVDQTADNVRSIAAAAEEQSAASDEISASTEHIANSAEENANSMQESSIAVSDLAKMAVELKTIINDMQ